MGGVSGGPLSYIWAATREINGVMNGCRCFYSCLWAEVFFARGATSCRSTVMVAPSHVPACLPSRIRWCRTDRLILGQKALRQEVPAHYGVALHHVSAKVGMMSRLVWEDGMSWAETSSVERPASADWLAP